MSRGYRGLGRRILRTVKPPPGLILVCDEPEEGTEAIPGTVVSGWAYSPAGIKEVSIWLDGQLLSRAEHGLERQDVAKDHPEWPDALHSGFRYQLDSLPVLEPAETAELAIMVEDEEGHRAEVRRVVRLVEYVVVCDEPEEGAEVTPGTVVNGWAYSPAGIKEVSIWLDGQLLSRAEHGLERQDVAKDHPEWPDALHSGFRYQLDSLPVLEPAETAELAIMVEDGEGRQAEKLRVVRPVDDETRRELIRIGRELEETRRELARKDLELQVTRRQLRELRSRLADSGAGTEAGGVNPENIV